MAIKTSDYKATKQTGIKIHKDRVSFLLDIKVDGKRYRRVSRSNPVHTSKDRLRAAYIAREAFHEEIKHKTNISADADATIGDYWTKVKSVSGWSDAMIRSYDWYFKKHLQKMEPLKIRDIKPAHFTSLNVSIKALAPRTQLKAYEILKPIFSLAIEDEVIFKSPLKKSHVPKRKQIEEKKVISDAESKYRRVYAAINDLFADNAHHRAGFLFGFHGRRLAETLNMHWEDIDFDNMTYTIRGANSKVNTDMVFTLPADVAAALSEFRDSHGKVFNVKSLDRHHEKIRKHTGIPEFTFHWMRNLCVSALASMGAEITHLSAMLGHNDSSTIKKYLSLQRETSTGKMEDLSRKLLS